MCLCAALISLIVCSLFSKMLTITLDESDCFAAWVSAKDAGFSSSDGSDPKCKIADPTPFLLFGKVFDSECDRICLTPNLTCSFAL